MRVGNFRYHWLLRRKGSAIASWLRMVCFFVREGLRLHREEPFDCLVAYSHMTSGVCGAMLKLLTGKKLIVQVATSPEHIGLTNRAKPSMLDRLSRVWSNLCLHVSLLSADRAHVLAPGLLDSFPLLRRVKTSVFHDFTSASKVPAGDPAHSSVVLLVGAPWYLKGADLLVKAFLRLADDFPEARLQFLGHFTDADELKELAAPCPRLEFLRARPQPEALGIIGEAAILVLPSRCEGMGRVLIEAMSAGLPVVGSKVGGIPYLIRDGENGFVFPSGDAEALEQHLRTLLGDPELRSRMGARGREIAASEFTEKRYAEEFTVMVQATLQGAP